MMGENGLKKRAEVLKFIIFLSRFTKYAAMKVMKEKLESSSSKLKRYFYYEHPSQANIQSAFRYLHFHIPFFLL